MSYLAKVVVNKCGNVDVALRKFKNKVIKEGIIQECKKREYYNKPGVKKRLKHEEHMKQLRIIERKRAKNSKNNID